jgi:gamma-F420-2:alpha-L-glutamate ligase
MLGNKITSEMYERERFIKVAHDMGIDFNVVFSDEIDLLVSRDDRRSIRYRGEAIALPDVCLARTGSGTGFYNLSVLRQQELIASLDSKNSMIIQEYVKESAGRDLRVIVVGGKVIGAMERSSTDGNFRANVSRGGVAKTYALDDEMEMLALQVARVLDLDICGVDLLFSDDGYRICEANSAPGFRGFEQATGINVPEKIFKYAGIRI